MAEEKYKKLVTIGVTVILLLFNVYVWSSNHGFFFGTKKYEHITSEFIKQYPLANGEAYSQTFVLPKEGFVGFALNLTGLIEDNIGRLNLSIYDTNETLIDTASVNISKIQSETWYPIKVGKGLQIGIPYVLQIENLGCTEPPLLQMIDSDGLPGETIDGELLIGYAYSEATFSDSERILISIASIVILLAIVSWTLGVGKWRYLLKQIALFVCLTILLAWNYTFNSLDISNIQFETFQADSESLVRGVIIAEHNNIAIPQTGLGLYQDASGTLFGASLNEFVTDENWDHGYSRIAPMVVIENNPYTQKMCREGNYIRFSNGDEIGILATFPYGNYLNVQLDAAEVLTESIYGDLHDIEFLNMQMEPQPKGELYVYPSQFGLQGRVFRSVAKYMDYNTSIQYLKLLCSIGTAGVFCLICFLLYRKYNGLLAGCFYITFLLSPWIVNFARNLYWVEFTWFLPIAVGLLCAIKIDSKRWRFLSYIVGWAAIFIKCLCGYEYLTAIMLGMISFLLADWFEALRHHERQNAKRLFFTVFFLGISALLGFVCAFCIHGHMVGNGDIVTGVVSILKNDVLRRTNGGSLADFGAEYWPSLNASIWEVIKTYFQFSTQLLTGIQGNIFPMLVISPIVCFFYNAALRRQEWKDVSLYVLSFVTSISWLVLAKAHSYIHTHMNYVLWYFGFVQICIYILCKQLIIIKNSRNSDQSTEIMKKGK